MELEKLYTVNEVAEILNVSPMTVRSYIKCEQLKATKISRVYRVKQSDLNYFIENGTGSDYYDKLKKYLNRA